MTTTIADGMSLLPTGWGRVGSVEGPQPEAWSHIVNSLANLIQLPAPVRGCFGWRTSYIRILVQRRHEFLHRHLRPTLDLTEVWAHQPPQYVARSIASCAPRCFRSARFALRIQSPIRSAFSDGNLACLRSRLEHMPDDDSPVFFDYLMNCGVERCAR
jgi:hypothetical protein